MVSEGERSPPALVRVEDRDDVGALLVDEPIGVITRDQSASDEPDSQRHESTMADRRERRDDGQVVSALKLPHTNRTTRKMREMTHPHPPADTGPDEPSGVEDDAEDPPAPTRGHQPGRTERCGRPGPNEPSDAEDREDRLTTDRPEGETRP